MSEVDEYLSKSSPNERAEMGRIRKLVKELAPDAEEGISYGIPGFKYKKKYLIGYAAFKDHMSIFPGSEAIEVFAKELQGFKQAKGTVQFTPGKPLSDDLLEKIIKFRVKDIDKAK